MSEQVNHPAHYNVGKIECIDAIEAALTPEEYLGFLKGTQLKYIWRAGHKDAPAQEMAKAAWYNHRAQLFYSQLRNKEIEDRLCQAHVEVSILPPEPRWTIEYFSINPIWHITNSSFLVEGWDGPGWYAVEWAEEKCFGPYIERTTAFILSISPATNMSIPLDKKDEM